MNEQQYQEAKKELATLETLDWEDETIEDWENIDYRIKCLQVDIFAHEHFMETGYNPYEERDSKNWQDIWK